MNRSKAVKRTRISIVGHNTAVTRASGTLYALNPPNFNSYSGLTFVGLDVLSSFSEITGSKHEFEEIVADDEVLDQMASFNNRPTSSAARPTH